MSDFEILYLVLMIITLVVTVFAATTRGARCAFSRNGHLSKLGVRCAHFVQKNNRP